MEESAINKDNSQYYQAKADNLTNDFLATQILTFPQELRKDISEFYVISEDTNASVCAHNKSRKIYLFIYYEISQKDPYYFELLNSLRQEISISPELKSSTLLPLFGYFADIKTSRIAMIYPFKNIASLGELRSISKEYNFDLTQKLIISYGVAYGMNYLYQHNVTKIDLSPSRVILNSNVEPVLTYFINHRPYLRNESIFLAPETSIEGNEYDEELASVYTFSVICYLLFSNLFFVIDYESKIEDLTFPENFNLFNKCLSTSPKSRPRFNQILNELSSDAFLDGIGEFNKEYFFKYRDKILHESENIQSKNDELKSLKESFDNFTIPASLIKQIDDFENETKIGEGRNSFVYKCNEKVTNKIFILKEMFIDSSIINDLKRNVWIHSMFREYEFIQPIYGIIRKSEDLMNEIFIVSPYMPNVDLAQMIKREKDNNSPKEWDDTQRYIVLYGVAAAMCFLHEHNIFSRNLKPENILLNDDLEPVISDMGFYENQYFYCLSPEILFSDNLDEELSCDGKLSDVFAFATIACVLYLGIISSFDTLQLFYENYFGFQMNGIVILSDKYQAILDLIIYCHNDNPEGRPQFDAIIEKLEDLNFIKRLGEIDIERLKKYQEKNFPWRQNAFKYSDKQNYLNEKNYYIWKYPVFYFENEYKEVSVHVSVKRNIKIKKIFNLMMFDMKNIAKNSILLYNEIIKKVYHDEEMIQKLSLEEEKEYESMMNDKNDPKLLILKYIFKKNNFPISFDTLDLFMKDKVSFQQVSQLMGIKLSYLENEKSRALEFFKQLNVKTLFGKERSDIFRTVNLIVNQLGISFHDDHDFVSIKTLIALLHILTDGLISVDYTKFFDQFLVKAFDIAKVPLLINKKSITEVNSDPFYIQVAIIFDIYSNKISQFLPKEQISDVSKEKLKSDERHFFSMQLYLDKMIEHFLHIRWDAVKDSIYDDNFQTFISKFINISIKDKFKFNRANSINTNTLIEYLSKKDEIFNILFDFSDINSIPEIALIDFYINFFNVFWIKNSKKELEERVESLLCTKLHKIDIFHDDIIYLYLLHFIIEGNLNLKIEEPYNHRKVLHEYYKKANVPIIINEELKDLSESFYSDFVYFQLKFIFDGIDNGSPSRKTAESLFNAIKKLQKVKVLNSEALKYGILAKCTSKKIQNKKILKQTDHQISKNAIKLPKMFKERYEIEKKKQLKNDDQISTEFQSYEKFWNSTRKAKYKYDNGIIFKQTNKNIDELTTEISNIYSNCTKSKKSLIAKDSQKIMNRLTFKSSSNNFESKLYKLFYYDEEQNRWIFDSIVFEQFSKDKKINVGNSQTPVVLILESYENDTISLASNLINGIYPNLENEEENKKIFVYGFCDRTLAMLNFVVDFIDRKKSSIKPIFLMLHVSKEKINLPNIGIVASKIYSFLSLICDIQIVILNKNQFFEQVDFIKNICNITKTAVSKASENKEKKLFFHSNLAGCDHLSIENTKPLIVKNSKMIFLLNDESFKPSPEIEPNIQKNKFLNRLLSQFEKVNRLHFINVSNSETYESFLSSLNDFILDVNSNFYDIQYNFEIQMLEISGVFIELKRSGADWRKELNKIINQRYIMLNSQHENKFDNFSFYYELKNEIFSSFPSYEADFLNESNMILSKLKEENSQKCREFFRSHLKISSDSDIEYINSTVKSKFFWTKEQIQAIQSSHNHLMKEEFFSIIQTVCSSCPLDVIFEENFDIVVERISKDEEIINKIFEEFNEKIELKKKYHKKVAKDEINKGTNYTMKETENIKEIEVNVEVGQKLESIIEQDF